MPKRAVGAKAVGMSGTIGVPAAIANALYDAVGVRLKAMPFTPERIVAALKEKRHGRDKQAKRRKPVNHRGERI